MRKAIQITIPEPCHEDWNTMTPELKGRHCSVCEKTVFDFTTKTDEYIVKTFEQDNKLCGRFKNSQLDRELAYSRKDSNNYLTYLASTLFAFIALGSHSGYAQGGAASQTYNNPTQVKGKEAHFILKERLISGTVLDENGLPMPGVSILIKGTTIGTQTDFDGLFQLKAKHNAIINFNSIGYIEQKLILNDKSKHGYIIRMKVDKHAIKEVLVTAGVTDVLCHSEKRRNAQKLKRQQIRNGEQERTKVGTLLYNISSIFRKRK